MELSKVLYTVGHSTHSWEAFVGMLRGHGVERVADVRRYPGSRKWPQFNADFMRVELPRVGMGYVSFTELGGRRKAVEGSLNGAWKNEAFRGYADYMMTGEFKEALGRLEEAAREKVTAILCAEALPWRCHRSLIADAMVARGWVVRDIMTAGAAKVHEIPAWGKVVRGEVRYPGEDDLFTRPG